MKKNFIFGLFFMVCVSNSAIADHIQNMDTPIQWGGRAVLSTMAALHGTDGGIYAFITEVLDGVVQQTTGRRYFASPKQMCDAYISATQKNNVKPVSCEKFIELLIQRHNYFVQKESKLTDEVSLADRNSQIKWYKPALTFACNDVVGELAAIECGTIIDLDCESHTYSIVDLKNICMNQVFINDENKCEKFLNLAVAKHAEYKKSGALRQSID